ncbi:DUF922 domain-containing protein [Pontibacter sp. BT731]|uniref:DUF922 domain-containing protein n=1 Tax=Pontibacter coccineus TaxID=3063328 RepID=UPI0026E37F69|nr:DUF922 domain-containing protein [Pontibacter sp. BT731]MDO6392067.1 DUF922 domain-containing protein [Pontibacter sp. BT731]
MNNNLLCSILLAAAICLPVLCNAQDDRIITWSKSRKLTWQDFKGKVEKETTYTVINLKKQGEADAARSRIAISLSYGCENGKADHEVYTEFEQSNSWTIPELQSPEVLAHEQLHFDIAELHARKLRTELAKLPNACDRNSVATLYYSLDAAFVEMTKQYDVETSHGTNKQQQAEWHRKVQILLQKP